MKINSRGFYEAEEIKFINTNEFIRTAQFFAKNGVYTKAHPIYDKKDYQDFWNEEEKRCRYGYTVGGVRITGQHYKFLNFNPIKRTVDTEELEGIVKDVKHSRKVGIKDVLFPDFWDGHYHTYHAKEIARNTGLNFIGNKGRRKGFSYMGGSDADWNYQFIPNSTTLLGAFDKRYLTKGDGLMTMFKNNVHFINKNTIWRKRRLSNAVDLYKSGYIKNGDEYGFKSIVWAISFKDNPDAALGKDAYQIILDECQTFPNFNEVLDATIPALEDGDLKTGYLECWGTGGSKEANWVAFEYNFYNPKDNNFMAFDNIWDPGARGTASGFFFPHYQNLVPHMDKDGNSNIELAIVSLDARREEKRKNTTPAKFLKYIAQRPKFPREAFTQGDTNIFVTNELEQHITRLRQDSSIKDLFRCGQLLVDPNTNELRLFTNEELESLGLSWSPPLLEFPLNNSIRDFNGCFVEYFPRYFDPRTGKIPKGLYRIWHDPYAFDKDKDHISVKDSLAVTLVYERANLYSFSKGDVIVAAYVGRPEFMNNYNDQLFKICDYYGGEDNILMFENDRGDVKNYATKNKKYHLLADEPTVDWNKQLQATKNGREKGITMGNNINRKGSAAIYYRDWLYTKRGKDKYGNDVCNYHYVYDLGLLQETVKWNLKGNFDRVSAILVGMFDKEEQFHKEITKPTTVNRNSYFNRKLFKK